MSDPKSAMDRLRNAYCLEASDRLRPSSPEAWGRPMVAEATAGGESRTAALSRLLHQMVDLALELADRETGRLREQCERWLDPDLAAGLGMSVERLQEFLLNETPRLINLNQLGRLLRKQGGLTLTEAGVLKPGSENPIVAGREGKFRDLLDNLTAMAANSYSILITGPTGTGKELIARRIHSLSPFANGPFVPVDCAALPENLVEAELFGFEKGAFTGAIRSKPGKVEMAAGGTLFLDEVAELPLVSQVKLLRFLQERVVERLGGGRRTAVPLRVVSATSRDLQEMTASGRFREDLYYRLATLPVQVPPLRDRPADIPLLIDHFLTEAALETGKIRRMSKGLLDLLLAYEFPGNIRELINIVNYAVVVSRGHVLNVDDLPPGLLERLPGVRAVETAWAEALAGLSLKPEARGVLAGLLAVREGEAVTNADLRGPLNCSDSTAKTILNRLAEAGLAEPEGNRGGRRYWLKKLTNRD